MKADALGAEKEATLKCIEPTLKSGMVFVFFFFKWEKMWKFLISPSI